MLHLYKSNRLERLVDGLAESIEQLPLTPLEPEIICVQSSGMRAWLTSQLADRFGIFANAKFLFPRELIENVQRAVLGDRMPDQALFRREQLVWTVMALLPDLLETQPFEPLRRYLDGEETSAKQWLLCQKIAHLFDEYALYRPDLVLGWEAQRSASGPFAVEASWQSILWRTVVEIHGSAHVARASTLFFEALRRGTTAGPSLPRRISVFGISALPPLHMKVLSGLALTTELNLFLLCPSSAYWAHIRSRREMTRQMSLPLGDDYPSAGDLHFEEGHPLLASYGRLGRDFQQVLEENVEQIASDSENFVDPLVDHAPTMLSAIQSDILNLRTRSGKKSRSRLRLSDGDDSIRIHSCHSPMREVEVIRDQLLALLDRDPSLRPEDMLVLTPDIEAYAPFIQAAFQTDAVRESPLPFTINGRGVRAESPVLDAFFSVLDLVPGRVTLHEVFDLLAQSAVREKFDLSAEAVEALWQLIGEAGVRWGIDGDHRRAAGQPKFEENTWRFGLDRVLLGYAMAGGPEVCFGDRTPGGGVEGQQALVLGRFVEFAERLFQLVATLNGAHSIPRWQQLLEEILDGLVTPSEHHAGQLKRIRQTLAELSELAARGGVDQPVELDLVRHALLSGLSDERSNAGFTPYGVTFASMLPLRSIPARVIGLMGMNDLDFPRSRQAVGFDLMARQPRIGDRSMRNDDNYLFLEALLAARETLVISYVGQSNRDGSLRSPSVVIGDLLAVARQSFTLPTKKTTVGHQLMVSHPLQPFSPRYFGAGDDPRLFTYAGQYLAGARALVGDREPQQAFFDAPLADRAGPVQRVVQLDDLIDFYRSPCRHLFKKRLGMRLVDDLREVDDREPVADHPLHRFQLGPMFLQAVLSDVDPGQLYEQIRRLGILPLGTPGEHRFRALYDQVVPMARAIDEIVTGDPRQPVGLDIDLGGDRLIGQIGALWPGARVLYRLAGLRAQQRLELWIGHLCMACTTDGELPGKSVYFGQGSKGRLEQVAFAREIEHPERLLTNLIDLYWVGQREPLRFIPDLSLAIAVKLKPLGPDDSEGCRAAIQHAVRQWRDSPTADDPVIRHAFAPGDPVEDTGPSDENVFPALALRVFAPLLANET